MNFSSRLKRRKACHNYAHLEHSLELHYSGVELGRPHHRVVPRCTEANHAGSVIVVFLDHFHYRTPTWISAVDKIEFKWIIGLVEARKF